MIKEEKRLEPAPEVPTVFTPTERQRFWLWCKRIHIKTSATIVPVFKRSKTTLTILAMLTIFGAPANAQGARIDSISTELNGAQVETIKPAATAQITSAAPQLSAKEAAREAEHARNLRLDLEYKALKQKPSKLLHPVKRFDLWADYHQDRMRKYRTRDLPVGQGVAMVVGMIFSIVAGLK